jgi:hypothetical protein
VRGGRGGRQGGDGDGVEAAERTWGLGAAGDGEAKLLAPGRKPKTPLAADPLCLGRADIGWNGPISQKFPNTKTSHI